MNFKSGPVEDMERMGVSLAMACLALAHGMAGF